MVVTIKKIKLSNKTIYALYRGSIILGRIIWHRRWKRWKYVSATKFKQTLYPEIEFGIEKYMLNVNQIELELEQVFILNPDEKFRKPPKIYVCQYCTSEVKQVTSVKRYGRRLCRTCERKAKAGLDERLNAFILRGLELQCGKKTTTDQVSSFCFGVSATPSDS